MSLFSELGNQFGLGQHDLARIIQTAPARYKVYEIPKRHGGTRVIAHPSRELKAIQRFVLSEKLNVFPIHDAAMAYVKGRGIRQNAELHRTNANILKLDFTAFFPSITPRDWRKRVLTVAPEGIDWQDLAYYDRILFWGAKQKATIPRCLSIGAPTSPTISNIVMYPIDVKLANAADRLGIAYSRYADDITVSANSIGALHEFEAFARRTIKAEKSPKLTFNDEKRGLYTKGQRRMVTGLILTPSEQISLGRERKREISSLLHRHSLDQLEVGKRGYLKGMLGFALAHEVPFVERMRRKYGDHVIDGALQYHVPKR